jgi:hypothetical protein
VLVETRTTIREGVVDVEETLGYLRSLDPGWEFINKKGEYSFFRVYIWKRD